MIMEIIIIIRIKKRGTKKITITRNNNDHNN